MNRCQAFQAAKRKAGKGEKRVGYSNRIMELFNEVESPGNTHSEIEGKRALLRGLKKDFDVTAEAITSGGHSYLEAAYKVIVRETGLEGSRSHDEKVFLMQERHQMKKCHSCGKQRDLSKGFWQKKRSEKRCEKQEKRTCYKFGKLEHIFKN